MEIIHENVHVMCFHVNFKHKSTKTCTGSALLEKPLVL